MKHEQEASGLSSVFLSTASLVERDRLPIWREVFGQAVVRLDIEPADEMPFQADGAMYVLPGVAFASVTSTPFRARRTTKLIQGDPDDRSFLVTATTPINVVQGGKEVRLGKGDAIFLRGTEACSVHSLQPGQFTNIAIQSEILAPLVSSFDGLSMTVVPARNELLGLLLGYIRLLRANHKAASHDVHRIAATHIRDLMAAIAGAEASADAERGGIRAVRLRAIKADIGNFLCDPELSIELIAARHGISPRYVRKLFQQERTTFSEFVVGLRLDRSRRLLLHPRYRLQTITSLAHACGFGDLSYFNRTFRRHYGLTPSELRDGAPVETPRCDDRR